MDKLIDKLNIRHFQLQTSVFLQKSSARIIVLFSSFAYVAIILAYIKGSIDNTIFLGISVCYLPVFVFAYMYYKGHKDVLGLLDKLECDIKTLKDE